MTDADAEFYTACLSGDVAAVRMLLEKPRTALVCGADVFRRPGETQALFMQRHASETKFVDIDRSATEPVPGYAHVPLYLACFGRNPALVLLLSERGAEFSARHA